MTKKDLEKKQKMIARIQEFTLMDDDFMTRFFENDKECTQFVLQTILENKNITVIEEVAQKVVKNLGGRSVRLDVYARDSSGTPYDIEIQRADKGAGAKRARYNSALMDADETVLGMDSEKLPESYVVFITETDIFKNGCPVYKIDRYINGSIPFNDGMHILYINGEYRGNDPIGDLMHDFHCKKPADMKNKLLADRARYLKEDDKGVRHMCKIMEDFAKEERDEAKIEMAAKLLELGKMSEEELIETFNLTDKQMQVIKEKVSVLA
ncbi:PD-(D/E)XK nuclease family transposase [Treponema zioleckii]|uniref:PD-(D/E)XK nuclease family transposase n=1 Tax=Treponema zioleckii TaxID=331680 RepID=UPI00168ABFE8|nr:PD-(D/E)XK nuclease family transposase [Treponema zioleckii]